MKLRLKPFRRLSQAIGLLACLLLLTCCQATLKQDGQQAKPGSELLKKTLAYHDPKGNWPQLKARFYLSSTDAAGKSQLFEIELDNTTGYFAHISHQDGKEVVKGISAGQEFFLLDGKTEISPEDRKKYKLTPESARGAHRFYGYLYGLPMKLTDPGASPVDAETEATLEGQSYRLLQVNYDPAVGKDNWFFYLDPSTYALRAYRFNHGKPESGEYILLEKELEIKGIKIPQVRKWYLNKNNEYLGTDTLLKAEPLRGHRI